ncbi:MAG: hypothetical protein KF858_12530 [Candidatus Sumerlaeia bacterium]|nr:hypothetical protein [Candidatus Sumerlaeia bacterium]
MATIGWDRDTDEFTVGQWMRGRIYERRCDLSPNGKLLIYFAMNGRWGSEARGAWSAISVAPYLKAKVLYPKGDCWPGGGLFLSAVEYWLNGAAGHEKLFDETRLKMTPKSPSEEVYGGECPGVYYIRLQRDGWTLKGYRAVSPTRGVTIFEKEFDDIWTIRKWAYESTNPPLGKGCYFDEHELVSPRGKEVIPCREWEWVDRDGDRLVWATDGKLFSGSLTPIGLAHERELFDFSGIHFSELVAPY